MKKRNKLFLLVAMMFCLPLFGQQISDLRLNEILINNDSNFVDEYGRHEPWIEIFNTSYNSVNVAACFLTDDTTGLASGDGNPNWYRIPQGDPKTLIPQRSYLIFFLDNTPLYGTFHTNFDPRESKNNYVALISSNGKTLIDMIHYPAALREARQSFGYREDGVKTIEDENGKVVSNLVVLEYFTPGSTNKVKLDATKSEKLKISDPFGWGLALISMAVVFSALILIYIMLKIFGYVSIRSKAKKAAQVQAATPVEKNEIDNEDLNGEELAAITMALHLHFNSLHDEESEVITIETPSAHYSPWSQKSLIMKRVQRKR
ncbi:MAG: OadG family transporter subunit [Bacteroidales bacterium]